MYGQKIENTRQVAAKWVTMTTTTSSRSRGTSDSGKYQQMQEASVVKSDPKYAVDAVIVYAPHLSG
jgi:hypothetical protein